MKPQKKGHRSVNPMTHLLCLGCAQIVPVKVN